MAAVFVYGTLMPNQPRWPLLAAFAQGEPVPDHVRGALVDTGCGYPGLVRVGDGGWVPGYALTLLPARVFEAFALLDGIEGTRHGLYRRLAVTTREGRSCQTYEFLQATRTMPELVGGWA